MKITYARQFKKKYVKLDTKVQLKVDKCITLLLKDTRHPSLSVKKMRGINAYEARVDYRYRITFDYSQDEIMLYTVGMHDEGLGKK